MAYITVEPILDVYHVAPSTIMSKEYNGYFAFDTSKSIIGVPADNSWLSMLREVSEQRINVDLVSPQIITRMLYINYHNRGMDVNNGVRFFEIYGSNANIMVDSYNRSDGLTLLVSGELEVCTFEAVPLYINIEGPVYNPVFKSIDFVNNVAYRFYVLKIWNNWRGDLGVGLRRIELQKVI